MSSVRKLYMVAAIGGIALLWSTSPAEASFELSLSDGSTTQVIVDQAALDQNPAVGGITFIGAVGPIFTFNVATGASKPVTGDAVNARMDLNSINVAATGPGTLTLLLTNTDFAPTPLGGTLSTSIGGTLDAGISLTAQTWKSEANVEFVTSGFSSGPLGPFTESSFSGGNSADHGALTTYSMTEKVVLTFGAGGGTASFDYMVSNIPVPEPATLASAFVGLGLLSGLGWLRRRRNAD